MAQINKEFLQRMRAELAFYKEKAKESIELEILLQEKERELEKAIKENEKLKETIEKHRQSNDRNLKWEERKKLLEKIEVLKRKLAEKNHHLDENEKKEDEQKQEDWFFRILKETQAIQGTVEPQERKEYFVKEKNEQNNQKEFHFWMMDDVVKND
ncbi:MAG: hypothetical protein C6W58_01290 [Bacillaceae bacterium]|jgi:hypothetical protein|uniref:Uncharacterized protein n=4 Tax=Aeribacillus TaxID=1055323 RepID=A0A165Y7P3_9BACI|nr:MULTISPECIES: hypothetical protein [Aeribacillus]REJ21160.1 MAG: hypothetical protein C6W58_01290 [Bacillaceae bacterium]KZN96810.1 hypothetical protein AZI98_06715 [Aeribacillus pallidus]MDR9796402.1 hypothetical protein [Aeribacillus pallidus]MED0704064.1 hypothetical protein [Aeribacillus composti]MED0714314.1 hypothetical protein [Aeribacillus composti]